MARTPTARSALLLLTACSALTTGVVTAGAGWAGPPDGSGKSDGVARSPTVTEPLGRKLK